MLARSLYIAGHSGAVAARYHGAPDPTTTPPSVVAKADLKEALRRLGTLQLAEGLSATEQRKELGILRGELIRLVQGYPAALQADVPLSSSPAAANAPNLNLSLIQQLLLLPLDPYFARVLGLYFVDEDTTPGVLYEYRITGYWGLTSAQSDVVYPALAQAAPLARGTANFDDMSIQALNSSSLWRWTRDDENGNYRPLTDPAAPSAVKSTVDSALVGFSPIQQPQALLAVVSKPVFFGFPVPPPEVSIKLPQVYPQVDQRRISLDEGRREGRSAGAEGVQLLDAARQWRRRATHHRHLDAISPHRPSHRPRPQGSGRRRRDVRRQCEGLRTGADTPRCVCRRPHKRWRPSRCERDSRRSTAQPHRP